MSVDLMAWNSESTCLEKLVADLAEKEWGVLCVSHRYLLAFLPLGPQLWKHFGRAVVAEATRGSPVTHGFGPVTLGFSAAEPQGTGPMASSCSQS